MISHQAPNANASPNISTDIGVNISAIVLCGGRGLRMGGVDKGLQAFKGQPLVQHVLYRLQPQVSQLMVNANRHLDQYQAFCAEVHPDEEDDFAGPLSGFLVGLEHARHPYLMTVPCDTPLIPMDLGERLYLGLSQSQANMDMIRSKDISFKHTTASNVPMRAEPVFCMMRTHLAPQLRVHIQAGMRKVTDWGKAMNAVWVDYDQEGDDPSLFSNINTLEDLHDLESTPSLEHRQ